MHFSFRIHHGKKVSRRQRDLADLGAARAEALTVAAEILGDSAVETGPVEMTIEARNSRDEPVFLVRIGVENVLDDDEGQAHPS